MENIIDTDFDDASTVASGFEGSASPLVAIIGCALAFIVMLSA